MVIESRDPKVLSFLDALGIDYINVNRVIIDIQLNDIVRVYTAGFCNSDGFTVDFAKMLDIKPEDINPT